MLISPIDPADSFKLDFTIDDKTQMVNLKCAVTNIYPRPEMKFK